MKHLTMQAAAPGQAILPQSGICFGCWSAQHGIWADIAVCVDIVTTPVAIALAPKATPTGAAIMPTIARIEKSRWSQGQIIPGSISYHRLQRKRRRLHFSATGRAAAIVPGRL